MSDSNQTVDEKPALKESDITPEIQNLLKQCVDYWSMEDRSVRERQLRNWRRLKLYWEGFQQVWWSDVAHDWRVWDEQLDVESYGDQSYYDKPINVFRALLESIIAALSITVPGVTCYPDDADQPLDLATAKAGSRIGKLLYRHNNATLLWLHALYIWCTEGMVAAYTYPKEDESYGTYEEKNFADDEQEAHVCPNCGTTLDSSMFDTMGANNAQVNPDIEMPPDQMLDDAQEISNEELDEFQPGDDDVELHDLLINDNQIVCPTCAIQLDPNLQKTKLIIPRFIGTTTKAKSRQCIEVYGGLYVKVPNWAMKQSDCPYLIFSYETHYSNVVSRYINTNKNMFNIGKVASGLYDPYESWARLSPQYRGEYPTENITVRNCWLRPSAFYCLDSREDADKLKKRFPDGVKVVFANDTFCEAEDEKMDDCWTLSYYPLSDYIHHDPLGMAAVNIQDIENELISLILQTIEHGISQTFVDPAVLNIDQYKQLEVAPGMVIATKPPRTGQKVSDGFFETRTATLSGEVLPFAQKIQELGQFVTGALPSLFGGQMEGTRTASEYSMSRAQALQRLQNNWKVFLVWWKDMFGKSINGFIKEIATDERYVERDKLGNFYNVFIRKSELEGKIGNIELEASENLPITWAQRKDIIMQFMENANPMIMQALTDPENIELFKQAIGLEEFVVPGEEDRTREWEIIQQLVNSEPIQVPTPQLGPDGIGIGMQEEPSVPNDPDLDNPQIGAAICRHWLIGEGGRLAKIENPLGYRNVLLRLKGHLMAIQQAQMQQMMSQMNQNPEQSGETGKPQNDKMAGKPQPKSQGAQQ